MANPEHLEILKQGVAVWNRWREENRNKRPDLSLAFLSEADLSKINLSWGDLSGADLGGTNLRNASLIRTNLSKATLSRASLVKADLRKAVLIEANLYDTDFSRAKLKGTNFSQAFVSYTKFGAVDLGETEGLDLIQHFGPSIIGIDTLYLSSGKISEIFLRGAGVPDVLIEYLLSLTNQPIRYYSCFISYSSKDETFAQRLHADLQEKGVRCWFAPEDMKIGDKVRSTIDQSIRVHDKLLVILSENSMPSNWVEDEGILPLRKKRNVGTPFSSLFGLMRP